jgi:hypothetical protein
VRLLTAYAAVDLAPEAPLPLEDIYPAVNVRVNCVVSNLKFGTRETGNSSDIMT